MSGGVTRARFPVLGCLLFAGLLAGCQSPAPKASPTPAATTTPPPRIAPLAQEALPPFNPLFVQAVLSGEAATSETTASHAYGSALCDLLSREDWDGLENLIARLRKSQETFPSGLHKLTNFYYALEASNGFVVNDNHIYHMRRLALWLRARPRSAAAYACMGRALQVFAEGKLPAPRLELRGTLPRDFPEVNAWLDHPREAVFETFDRARSLAPNDPELWALTIKAARLLKAPEKKTRAWIEEARRRFPDYPAILGQTIQWELAQDPGYAWWDMKANPDALGLACVYANLKANSQIFARLAPFLQQAVEKHPTSLYLRSKLAYYAVIANRLQVADEQLKIINYNFEAMAGQPAALFFNYYQVHGIAPDDQPRAPIALDPLLAKADPALKAMLLYWQVEGLLTGRRYEELDAIGAGLRSRKDELAPSWYHMLAADVLKHRPQVQQEELLRAWLKARPQSYDARLALALILEDQAGEARGGGWASEVTDEQWAEFRRLHGEAWQLYQEIQQPDAFTLAQGISLLRNVPDGKRKAYQLLDRAVQQEPHLMAPYRAMAMLLLPRWAGEPGELQKFLKKSEKSFGPGLDGVIGLSLSEVSGVAEEEHFTDQRILSGLEKLARARPTAANRNLFAATAFQKKNRAYARKAFEMLGKDWDRKVFLDSLTFAKCREWARNPGSAYPVT